jgi:radical SAM protein with 4Fe4S-binding SPASM domain
MVFNRDIVLPASRKFAVFATGGDYLVIDANAAFWTMVSRDQFPAFSLLDGRSTVSELEERVQNLLPGNLHAISLRFLTSMTAFYPTDTKTIQKADKLSTIYLLVTEACNSNCIYCYQGRHAAQGRLLDVELGRTIIKTFAQMATLPAQILFTGGEPLLHPKLIEMAQESKSLGLRNILQTNGLLLEPAMISAVTTCFDEVQLSLDSVNPEVNDDLRGQAGHFASVRQALEALATTGIRTRISATITRRNFDDIQRISAMFPHAEFKYTPMLSIGRAKSRPDLGFTPEEFGARLRKMDAYGSMARATPLPPFGRKMPLCAAGTGLLSIRPNGSVYPCHALHRTSLRCGSLQNATLDDIYKHSPVLEKFRRLSVDDLSGCRECDLRYVCGGGCRANALGIGGNLLGRDPMCEFVMQQYLAAMTSQFKPSVSGSLQSEVSPTSRQQ